VYAVCLKFPDSVKFEVFRAIEIQVVSEL